MYILASETSRSRATQLRSPRDRLVASLGAYVHGTFLQRLKSHRHATGTSTSLLLTCQLCLQVHNFCVNLHGFAFRKTLHISQDVICWQSWSNSNSKYGLVRRTYTIYYGRTRCFRASWRICF